VRERSLVAADLRTRFHQFGQGTTLRLDAEEREQLENIQDSFAGRPTEEIAAARAHLRSTRPAGTSFEDHPALRQLSRGAFIMPAIGALVWALFSILFAFLFRGGLSLRIVSLALRNRRGQRAGRLRCTGRAVLVALPFVAIYAPSLFFAMKSGAQASVIALVAGAAAHAFLVAAALRDPARGWQDRLAGTRIVPR
jgi:hypothetical protein